MDRLRARIWSFLPKEKRFLNQIYSQFIKDHAFLWKEVENLDIAKLRYILMVIVKLFYEEHKHLQGLSQFDQQEFNRAVRELISNPDALMQKAKAAQYKTIDRLGPEKWFNAFRKDIEKINEVIERNERSKLEDRGTDIINRIMQLYNFSAMVKVVQYALIYFDEPVMVRRRADTGKEDDLWNKYRQMVDLIKSISDRAIALNLVKRKGILLFYMSDVFKNDHELVVTALRTGTELYSHLSDELKNDREVALAAAGDPKITRGTNDTEKIMELPKKFRADKRFVIEFLKQNGHQLLGFQLAPKDKFPELKKWWHDKEVVIAAVESSPMAIQAIPEELANDREIVLTAVRKNGFSLGYWSYLGVSAETKFDKNLCNDIEIAIEAVKQDPEAISFVGDKLKNDQRILTLVSKKQ